MAGKPQQSAEEQGKKPEFIPSGEIEVREAEELEKKKEELETRYVIKKEVPPEEARVRREVMEQRMLEDSLALALNDYYTGEDADKVKERISKLSDKMFKGGFMVNLGAGKIAGKPLETIFCVEEGGKKKFMYLGEEQKYDSLLGLLEAKGAFSERTDQSIEEAKKMVEFNDRFNLFKENILDLYGTCQNVLKTNKGAEAKLREYWGKVRDFHRLLATGAVKDVDKFRRDFRFEVDNMILFTRNSVKETDQYKIHTLLMSVRDRDVLPSFEQALETYQKTKPEEFVKKEVYEKGAAVQSAVQAAEAGAEKKEEGPKGFQDFLKQIFEWIMKFFREWGGVFGFMTGASVKAISGRLEKDYKDKKLSQAQIDKLKVDTVRDKEKEFKKEDLKQKNGMLNALYASRVLGIEPPIENVEELFQVGKNSGFTEQRDKTKYSSLSEGSLIFLQNPEVGKERLETVYVVVKSGPEPTVRYVPESGGNPIETTLSTAAPEYTEKWFSALIPPKKGAPTPKQPQPAA